MKHVTPLAATAVAALLLAGCSSTPDAPSGDPSEDTAWSPSRNVTLLIPYVAGGLSDLTARALAECLSDGLGTSVVVENKPAGAGAEAMGEVARATADGLTIGLGTQSTIVTTSVLNDVGYTYESFDYIGQILSVPSVILIKSGASLDNLPDMIEMAEDEPGSVQFAISGPQASFSLAVRQLASQGVEITNVPFQGDAETIPALLGDKVDAVWTAASASILESIEAGEIEAIAVGASERISLLPDVPTLEEEGVTGLIDTETFYPLVAPKGLPDNVLTTLASTTEGCVGTDAYREFVKPDYAKWLPGDELTDRLIAYRENVVELAG